MENTEFVIRENGTITERTVRERDLQVEESVLDAMTAEVSRKLWNVTTIPDWGIAHANVGLNDVVWSVRINRIPLKARFRLINQVLVPVFASPTDLEMSLVWQAPKDVQLVFAVQTEFADGSHNVLGNWLFAFSKANHGYRLPLPNLHDDCTICTGDFADEHGSAVECVTASLAQFNQSKWNADLMRTVEESQKFFRFRPTDESFETLPMDAADWTTLCEKVSTAIMDRVIL
jgi:hypothetical protein